MAYEAYTAVFEMLRRSTKPSSPLSRGRRGRIHPGHGCDFVIADRRPGLGVEMRRVPRRVDGPAHQGHATMELLLSADMLPADTLFRMGLVNELAADDKELKEFETQDRRLGCAGSIAGQPDQGNAEPSTMPLAEALVMAKS